MDMLGKAKSVVVDKENQLLLAVLVRRKILKQDVIKLESKLMKLLLIMIKKNFKKDLLN